ncbi:MAG: hypothetical protein CM15mP92_2530 [Halieaceae bacterium]|nr:MAG: hypothetical protein CM15mP92_2530 [Halieaceae bacterium]
MKSNRDVTHLPPSTIGANKRLGYIACVTPETVFEDNYDVSFLKEQKPHAALPQTNHDELSRQHFVRSFKEHIVEALHPGLKLAYENRGKPKFVAQHGREPATIQEVGEAMKPDQHYQAWSSLLRTSQEMMWS